MATTADPNEQNFINSARTAITSNNVDAPHTGRIQTMSPPITVVHSFYATRTALNATTGQTESDTALIIG